MSNITCTENERDKLLYKLGKGLRCSSDCATRLVYGCSYCIAHRNNSIVWDITDLGSDSMTTLAKELNSVFYKYGYYVDYLDGQFADDGEWKMIIKKGVEPNGEDRN